jgi:hypothetical protein
MMISGRMIWMGHVTLIGEKINGYGILWGNLNETDHSEDLGVDEDNRKVNLRNK